MVLVMMMVMAMVMVMVMVMVMFCIILQGAIRRHVHEFSNRGHSLSPRGSPYSLREVVPQLPLAEPGTVYCHELTRARPLVHYVRLGLRGRCS